MLGHTDCTRCGIRKHVTQVVPGYGNPRALIAIVGEAPGRDEDREGRPFIGAAGTLLREIMIDVGIDPALCWFSNLLHCRPPKNDFAKGLELGGAVCRTHWLWRELFAIKPWIIVAAGARAGRVLLNVPDSVSATEMTKMTYNSDVNEFVVVGMFHPSFALRSGESDRAGPISDSIRRSLIHAQKIMQARVTNGGKFVWVKQENDWRGGP